MNSIPAGLAIREDLRLLAYLKVKYQPGYFHKSELNTIARKYGKDLRTVKTLLRNLVEAALIGENATSYFLRKWKYITSRLQLNTQAFKATLSEIKNKEIFESKLFAAKITSLQKTFRRAKKKARESEWGFSHQSASSGILSKVCQVSTGKISILKRKAANHGFISVEKSLHDHGPGTVQTAMILARELPGLFLKDGRLKRRQADQITSKIETFRIRNRKNRTNQVRKSKTLL